MNGESVERVLDFRFLGIYIQEDLTWTINTKALLKNAQQRLYFLRILRKNNLQEKMLMTFYRSTIENALSYGISLWFASCTAAGRKALQRVIKTAQKVIRCPLLLFLEDVYNRNCRRAHSILRNSSHPGHKPV